MRSIPAIEDLVDGLIPLRRVDPDDGRRLVDDALIRVVGVVMPTSGDIAFTLVASAAVL